MDYINLHIFTSVDITDIPSDFQMLSDLMENVSMKVDQYNSNLSGKNKKIKIDHHVGIFNNILEENKKAVDFFMEFMDSVFSRKNNPAYVAHFGYNTPGLTLYDEIHFFLVNLDFVDSDILMFLDLGVKFDYFPGNEINAISNDHFICMTCPNQHSGVTASFIEFDRLCACGELENVVGYQPSHPYLVVDRNR